jgi:hypothetical protein
MPAPTTAPAGAPAEAPAEAAAASPARNALGTLCAEAQADGVPCAELGTDCEICGRATPCTHSPAPAAPAAPAAPRLRPQE